MGRVMRAALPLLVWVIWAPAAFGLVRPSFDLDDCGWHATHIVVITEGKKIDGKVVVLESWRGNLRKGDRLDLPDLAAFASLDSRAISQTFDKPGPNEPQHVTGSRMVLFLTWKATGSDPSQGSWAAACRWGGMRVSLAWIEAGESYACVQWVNPGPSVPYRLEMTERRMQERVQHLARVRGDLDRAAVVPDAGKRAAALCPFVGSDVSEARGAALRLLAGCGEPALPAFRKLLADASLSRHHAEVVQSLGKAGGQKVGKELTEMLGRELTFWKKKGLTLPAGWWNGGGLNWTEVESLRDRYGLTLAVVQGLGQVRCPEGSKAVKQFRDFWLSLPQLKEIGQMGKECDRVLAEPLPGPLEPDKDAPLDAFLLGLGLVRRLPRPSVRGVRQAGRVQHPGRMGPQAGLAPLREPQTAARRLPAAAGPGHSADP